MKRNLLKFSTALFIGTTILSNQAFAYHCSAEIHNTTNEIWTIKFSPNAGQSVAFINNPATCTTETEACTIFPNERIDIHYEASNGKFSGSLEIANQDATLVNFYNYSLTNTDPDDCPDIYPQKNNNLNDNDNNISVNYPDFGDITFNP